MTTAVVLLWTVGGVAFVLAGYLFGAQLGRKTRDQLRYDLEQANYEVEVFNKQADALSGLVVKDIQRDIMSAIELVLERDAAGGDSLKFDSDVQSRGQLQQLLDLIASKGQFATVLVSDETGLPVATNHAAEGANEIAALSASLLGFVDRTEQVHQPAPSSIMVYDATKRSTLHRIFKAGNDRYLLTAVAKSGVLPPTLLDPVLGKLQAVLADRTLR